MFQRPYAIPKAAENTLRLTHFGEVPNVRMNPSAVQKRPDSWSKVEECCRTRLEKQKVDSKTVCPACTHV